MPTFRHPTYTRARPALSIPHGCGRYQRRASRTGAHVFRLTGDSVRLESARKRPYRATTLSTAAAFARVMRLKYDGLTTMPVLPIVRCQLPTTWLPTTTTGLRTP